MDQGSIGSFPCFSSYFHTNPNMKESVFFITCGKLPLMFWEVRFEHNKFIIPKLDSVFQWPVFATKNTNSGCRKLLDSNDFKEWTVRCYFSVAVFPMFNFCCYGSLTCSVRNLKPLPRAPFITIVVLPREHGLEHRFQYRRVHNESIVIDNYIDSV
jgi:hypothetical protein